MPPLSSASRLCSALILLVSLALCACTKEAKRQRVVRRAETYFHQGKLDNARVEYLNLLRLEPQSVLAFKRLGAIWLTEGAPIRAAGYLIRCSELAPGDDDNQLALARAFVAIGRRRDAFEKAIKMWEKAPDKQEALSIAAEAADKDDERQQVSQAISQARQTHHTAALDLAVATLALSLRDYVGAAAAIDNALAKDPKSAAAHLLKANVHLSRNEVSKAGEELHRAAELAPPRSAEHFRYAEFLVRTRAVDEAVKTLRSVTAAAPDYLPAWNLQAEISLGRNAPDDALSCLANVLNRDPDNIDATILQSRALVAKSQTAKAVQALERLDARYGGLGPVEYEIARCYLKQNDLKQAVAVLNRALSSNPDYVDAAVLLGRLKVQSGDAKSVVEMLKPMAVRHPQLIAISLLLADAYRLLGRLDDAANVFRDLLQLAPDNAEAHLALGFVLRQQNKIAEATEKFEQAQKLSPNNPLPLVQLVDIDLAARQYDKAHSRVEQQRQSMSGSATPDLLDGKIFAAQGKWDVAERALQNALKLEPNSSAAYELLASVYLASGRRADAAQQLEAVVSRSPRDGKALMSLAVLYEKLGRFDDARSRYEKLLTIAREFVPALNNLAWLEATQFHDLERAQVLAEKARSLRPDDASVADTLGWILYKQHHYQQALSLLTEAGEKSPDTGEIQYHIGLCHYMMGQTAPARLALERAVKSPSGFSSQQDARRRLALLTREAGDPLPIDELERLLQEEPDDFLARTSLAEAYVGANRPNDAAAQFQQLLKQNRKFVPAMTALAKLYSGPLNDLTKSLQYAREARDLSPEEPRIALLLGWIVYQTGNYPWAYSLLKESGAQLPRDVEAQYKLGWSAFSVGRIDEATGCMKAALELGPSAGCADDARRWLSLMEVAQAGSPSPELSSAVSRSLSQFPDYAPAQLALARLHIVGGKANEAIALYQQVLTRFPNCAFAQKQLAAAYASGGADLAKAYELASKARKTLADDPELAGLLGEISYQRKEYRQALDWFEESGRKSPLDPKHLYYAGLCSLQIKNTARAREAFSQALAGGLENPLAADAKRALRDLR
jgi:tetratricopeptide (TPR) repeat protein